MDSGLALHVFSALFAIMNPIANMGILLSLTAGMDAARQRRVALVSATAAAVGCALSVVAGTAILAFFGIDTNSFRVAGGVLVFLIALSMIHGEQSSSHHGSAREKGQPAGSGDDPSVFPLAVPILVGPGTISTLVVFANHAETWPQKTGLWAGVAAALMVLGAVFVAAPTLSRIMGPTAERIVTRVMGMLLAAIGVGMWAQGMRGLLPGLG